MYLVLVYPKQGDVSSRFRERQHTLWSNDDRLSIGRTE